MVKGYKKTEIGLLPQNWEVKTIGKISTPKARIGWQNLRKEEYMESGLYMLITGTDFEDGRVNYSTCKFVSENRYEQDPNIQVKNGDVLVTKDGTLGKVAIIKGLNFKATLNAGVFVLGNLSSSINNEFLYQYLSTNRLMKYAERTSTGGTIQHLNQGVLVDFPIPVPPVEEQARIAAALSDIDDLIIKSEELIKKYQTMKQGCLQHMFPRNGQTEPDMRLPGFSGAWEQHKLGDVLDDMYNGQTPSRNKSEYWNGNIKWLSSGELNRGTVYDSIEMITENGQKSANLRIVPKGTFIMAITGLETAGTRGNCALLGFDTTLNQSCMALFPKKDLITSDFLFQWYRKVGEEYGLNYTQGTKQQSYNAELIKILPISLPSVAEQKKIASYLRNLDHLIALHQRKREKYKMIKQGMMEDLLTGKVRLK